MWASACRRTPYRAAACVLDPSPWPTSITMACMVVGYHRLDGRHYIEQPQNPRPECSPGLAWRSNMSLPPPARYWPSDFPPKALSTAAVNSSGANGL